MKRRRFQSIALIPKCGYVAICEEGYVWMYYFANLKWEKFLELPPIEEASNAGLVTREEYVKDYDRRHGTDPANLPASFLDPSLGQPWPEDQVFDRPAVSPEPTVRQDHSDLVAKIDRAERLLNMSCWKRAATNPCPDVTDIIDISFALRSLLNDIRSEFSQ
jgi:hypothetical protein